MDSLIARINLGGSDLTTLVLSSECETREQLNRLLHVLAKNNHGIHTVVFRGPFFRRRRIQQRLDEYDFPRMLECVSKYATHILELPSTMPGMLRGETASLTVSSLKLLHFRAAEAITFGTDADVQAMAGRLQDCTKLQSLELGDSYFMRRSQPPCWDPIIQAVAGHETLECLELSNHPEQRIKQPLITTTTLEILLQNSSSNLQTLNLSRLSLIDDHYETLANVLMVTTTGMSLKWLCLDGNRPSQEGLQALANALGTGRPSLQGVSLLETRNTDRIAWNDLFPQNVHLQHLELDQEIVASQNGLDWWMELNRLGRSDWIREANTLPLQLWPLVLQPISESPSILCYILQTFPQLLSFYRTIDDIRQWKE